MVHTVFLYLLNTVPVYLLCRSAYTSSSSTLVVHTLLSRWFDVAPALVLRCSHVVPLWFTRCSPVVRTLFPRGSRVVPVLFPRGSRVVPALFPRCPRVALTSFTRFGCENETIDLLVFLRGFEDGSPAASVSTVFTGRPFGLMGFSLVSLSLFVSLSCGSLS